MSPAGPHPFPPARTWGFTQHTPFQAVYDHNRRSLYLMTQRIRRHPFLGLFDGADASSSTPERHTTTVPTQALFFLNDPFIHARASSLAQRLSSLADDRARQERLTCDCCSVEARLWRNNHCRRASGKVMKPASNLGPRQSANNPPGLPGRVCSWPATNSCTSIEDSEMHSIPSRRTFLRSAVAGSILMPAIVQELLAEDDPLAAKKPHFAAKAKRIIFLFMSGGVSHVDSFDHKPKLTSDHGKLVKLDHPETRNRPGYEKLYLKKPQWTFRARGKSGLMISDLFPHVANCADDLTVIRSLHSDHSNHYNATLGMHTGSFNVARPSIGSWVSYGLGTTNRNLPSFMVIAPRTPYAGGQVWASDFLPGSHQGTLLSSLGPSQCATSNRAWRPPLQAAKGTGRTR